MNWRDVSHPMAGGAEVFTHEVAKRWVKWGHDVTLLTSRPAGTREREEVDGVNLIRHGGRFKVYPYAMKVYMQDFRGNVDVVIDEINYVPFFTPLYVKEPKVALIHQLARECWFAATNFPLVSHLGYLFEPAYLRLYRSVDAVVTVSESTKLDLMRVAGIGEEKIRILPEGNSSPQDNAYDKSPVPLIAYLGRISSYKGLEDLVKATVLLRKKISNLRTVIAGKADGHYLGNIVRLAADYHAPIEFLTGVSEEDRLRLLSEAWACVHTSVREGFGLNIIDAASMGTPTVAYDSPGLRDAVINGQTGILVPSGNLLALVDGLSLILLDDILRAKLSANAIRWSSAFDWKNTAKTFLNLLAAVADRQYD